MHKVSSGLFTLYNLLKVDTTYSSLCFKSLLKVCLVSINTLVWLYTCKQKHRSLSSGSGSRLYMQCSSRNLQKQAQGRELLSDQSPCYLMWRLKHNWALTNSTQTLDSINERLGLMGAMCRAGLSLVRLACLCRPSGKSSWEDAVPLLSL